MEELVENFNSFEYSGNLLHSNDDTNDSDDEEVNEYQAITLETGDEEKEVDEPEQIDLEIDKNLDIPIVLYVLVMSRTRLRVNPHSIVA